MTMNMLTPVSANPLAANNQIMANTAGNSPLGHLFSSLLAKTVEGAELPGNELQLEGNMAEGVKGLAELLQFLKSETASAAGISQSVIIEMVINGVELQDHPDVLHLVNGAEANISLEENIKSLLQHLDIPLDENDSSMITGQLLSQMQAVLPKLEESLKGGNIALLVRPDAQTAIRLSKIYTLLQADLNIPEAALERIGQLKESLNRLAAKLEDILKPAMKAAVRFEGIMARAQSHIQIYSHSTHQQMPINQNKTMDTMLPPQNIGSEGKTAISEMPGNASPFLLMSKTEQYVITLPDKPQVKTDQFLKEFEALMGKAKFTNINGIQKLLLKLNPEHLGSLRIELIQKDGAMVAKIIATTAMAKNLLDSHTKAMKEAFINQSITVERLEISQAAPAFTQERNLQKDPEQRQQGNPGNQQQEETDGFMEQLEDAKSQMEEAEV